MLIKTKAPLRINFAGGGTDVEPYSQDYGGSILSASINLYARAICGLEDTPQNDMEAFLTTIARKPIKLISDVHEASGLGGSSTCVVAGIKAIYPELQKEQIATLAFYLERSGLGILGGIQDQYCAAYGGMLYMTINGDRTYVETLKWPKVLSNLLVLIYAGDRKVDGGKIIENQNAHCNLRALHRQKQIAVAMREHIIDENILEFGKLLGEVWKVKCEMSDLVTTQEINELHSFCCGHGAVGGCIMGAGSGGYMLFMEHPDKEGELRQALVKKNISYLNIELDTEGVRII